MQRAKAAAKGKLLHPVEQGAETKEEARAQL